MDLISIAENLAIEVKKKQLSQPDTITLTDTGLYSTLSGVHTDAYDAEFESLSMDVPEVTVAYGKNNEIVEVFATRKSSRGEGWLIEDTKGNAVPIKGGIDAEQFLYLCGLLYNRGDLTRISVFRQDGIAYPFNIREMDPLFLLAALNVYKKPIDDIARNLVIEVLQASDDRFKTPKFGCKQTGWCLRSWESDRCSKTWGLCYGIPPLT